MKVAITGASGLIGSALAAHLRARGDEVVGISHRGTDGPSWTTEGGLAPPDALAGHDAVVHLAGESLNAHRWTSAQKTRIRDSRVLGTRTIVAGLRVADPRPPVLVTGTGISIYGDRGDAWLTETSAAGEGFLAQLCRDWEAEARAAESLGTRVVLARTAPVIARTGGLLAPMLTPFRAGLGARVASGRQFMSWVHLDDLVCALTLLLDEPQASGPINMSSPCPVTNAEFTRTLARALHRPAWLAAPAFGMRLLFGEIADALLASQRVEPARLRELGFQWQHPTLVSALEQALGTA